MGFLADLLPVLKKQAITFIEKKKEVGNAVTFVFKCSQPSSWKAGQHGIISFSGKLEGGSWRGFSIASSPEDENLMISTRIPDKPSAFKKALMDLKPGDQLTMRGPFGPFYLDGSRRPVVFIASGIGITPYRALILFSIAHQDQAPREIRLLHSDDRSEYAYKEEFDEIASRYGFVKAAYVSSTILPEKIESTLNELGNDACYYVSGPNKMVAAIKKMLTDKGIVKGNIKHEVFIGL